MEQEIIKNEDGSITVKTITEVINIPELEETIARLNVAIENLQSELINISNAKVPSFLIPVIEKEQAFLREEILLRGEEIHSLQAKIDKYNG